MPLNRVVALLIPIAAPFAGWVSTQAATQLPGLDLPKSALEEVFIAGALFALAPAAQWLHGWQKWETQQAQTEAAIQVAAVDAAADPPTVQVDIKQDDATEPDEGFEDDGFDASFELDEFDDFDDELLGDEDPIQVGS
jgi:hypothetical protein